MNQQILLEEIRVKINLSDRETVVETFLNNDAHFLISEQLPSVFHYPKRKPNLSIDHTGIVFKGVFYSWQNIQLTCIRTIDAGRFKFYSFIFLTEEKKILERKFNYAFWGIEPNDFHNIIELYKQKWQSFKKKAESQPFHYNIRRAKADDLEHLIQLFKATIHLVNAKDYSPDQIAVWTSSAENRELWTKRLNEQYFLVAENAEEITGFASIDPRGCIDLLYVHKDHQRKGIAEKLLEELEKYAYENKLAEVWADVSIIARPFFAAKGFTIKREYFKFVQGVEFKQAIMIKTLAKK